MGRHINLRAKQYPAQGQLVGKRVRVFFHGDYAHPALGRIIRDDREDPFRLIIQLNDGRVVTSDECDYGFPPPLTLTR